MHFLTTPYIIQAILCRREIVKTPLICSLVIIMHTYLYKYIPHTTTIRTYITGCIVQQKICVLAKGRNPPKTKMQIIKQTKKKNKKKIASKNIKKLKKNIHSKKCIVDSFCSSLVLPIFLIITLSSCFLIKKTVFCL